MTDEPKGFAEYPISVGEAKANRTNSACEWSPREALICALRDIDKGNMNPDALIVVMRERSVNREDGRKDITFPYYYTSAPDTETVLGLLARAQMTIVKPI